MKNLRNLLATITLMAILVMSASTAKAGIMLSDLSGGDTQSCTAEKNNSKVDWGIVLTGFTGIVLTGFTGIVLTGAVDTPADCGILITD
jgi:hypothetical protein